MNERVPASGHPSATPPSPPRTTPRLASVMSRPVLPERLRRATRPSLLFEALLIGISYWLYSLVRNAAPTRELTARDNAEWILDVERMLLLDIERSVNEWFAGVEWLVVGANYYYATAHFVVTVSVLVWLYVRHSVRYRAARSALYLTNAIALVGFYLYPLAPPRLMPGYIDTVREFNTWGSLASGDLASQSNQFAAMPSMHIGWALWSGMALVYLARRRWVRMLGMAYPVATLVVIVATANHYVLDAVGGIAALACGFALQWWATGRRAFTSPRRGREHPPEAGGDEPEPGRASTEQRRTHA